MSSCNVLERGIRLVNIWRFTQISFCNVLLLLNSPSFPFSPLHPLSWEPQRQVNLRSGLQLDPLGVPALIWPHQPLVRTQSSPASTSLPPPPHPPTAIPTLSLSSPAADVQLRFTTGEGHFFEQETVKRGHESH